jgi:hypothetical protein
MFHKREVITESRCCFCNSLKVRMIAPFGTAQLVRQYYCEDCKSVFEQVKWDKTNFERRGD